MCIRESDTAGRDSLDGELKDELLEIASIANASERFLVIDAQVGQAAGPMAETFHELVGVTGTIVTKLDGTAKGGIFIGISDQMNIPVKYIGVGEKIEDLQLFDKKTFVDSLFS